MLNERLTNDNLKRLDDKVAHIVADTHETSSVASSKKRATKVVKDVRTPSHHEEEVEVAESELDEDDEWAMINSFNQQLHEKEEAIR